MHSLFQFFLDLHISPCSCDCTTCKTNEILLAIYHNPTLLDFFFCLFRFEISWVSCSLAGKVKEGFELKEQKDCKVLIKHITKCLWKDLGSFQVYLTEITSYGKWIVRDLICIRNSHLGFSYLLCYFCSAHIQTF